MLKTRLIPILYIKNGLIVRSEGFSYHQNIGNIVNEAKRYNDWNVDELIYIDISREKHYDIGRDDHKIKSYSSITEIIDRISKVCFMPLTFGGGIRNMEDIDLRVRNGADKVSLNTQAFETPALIEQAALKYGSQCVVVSIDYRIIDGVPIVFTHFGQHNTNTSLWEWATRCEDFGAGELLINCIDRDGKANGFDIPTVKQVAAASRVPVVACGGAGDPYDFVDLAKETKVSGIAAGNIFHFTERSYPRAKELMKKNNVNVR